MGNTQKVDNYDDMNPIDAYLEETIGLFSNKNISITAYNEVPTGHTGEDAIFNSKKLVIELTIKTKKAAMELVEKIIDQKTGSITVYISGLWSSLFNRVEKEKKYNFTLTVVL